jgi:alpha-2-macroglobulin
MAKNRCADGLEMCNGIAKKALGHLTRRLTLWMTACLCGIAWAGAGTAGESDRELRVLYVTPQGEAPITGRIGVVFNHPLFALDAEPKSTPFLHIEPAIEGRVQWHGTSALEFVPKSNTLPYATHFSVSIDAGVTDFQGRELKEPLVFQFDTPPVAVTFGTPTDEWLFPNSPVNLRFEPAVELAELRRNLSAYVEVRTGATRCPFEILVIDKDRREYVKAEGNPRVVDVVIAPKTQWPLSSRLHVEVKESLHVPDGPRPLGTLKSAVYRTPEPFRVAFDCGASGCRTAEPVLTSNRRLWEPEQHLQLIPELAPTRIFPIGSYEDTHRTVSFTGYIEDPAPAPEPELTPLKFEYGISPLEPLTDYRLRTTTPLESDSDELLKGSLAWRFRTPGLVPSVEWEQEASGTVIENQLLRGMAVRGAGGPAVAVQTRRLTESDLDPIYAQQGSVAVADSDRGRVARSLLNSAWRTVIPKTSQRTTTPANLSNRELFGEDAPLGPWLLGAAIDPGTAETGVAMRLLQPTSLSVTAWRNPEGLRVWVRDRNRGQPVSRGEVVIHHANRASRTTRRELSAVGDTWFSTAEIGAAPARDARDISWMSIRHEHDWVTLPLGSDSPVWLISNPNANESPIYSTLWSDRDLYGPEETAYLFGIARRWRDPDLLPLAHARWKLRIGDHRGGSIANLDTTTDAHGFFSIPFRIPNGVTGELTISAGPEEKTGSASRRIMVEPYTTTPAQLKIQGLAQEYHLVSTIPWQLEGKYLTQAPTAKARVTTEVYVYNQGLPSLRDEDWKLYAPSEQHEMQLPDVFLGDSGLADQQVTITGDVFGPEVLLLRSSMTEVTGGVFSDQRPTRLYRSHYYVGLRLPKRALPMASKPFPLDVAAFTPDGVFVPNVPVELRLETRSRSEPHDSVIQHLGVTTSAGPTRVWLEAPTEGQYGVWATATDHSLKVHSELDVYVRKPARASENEPIVEERDPTILALLDRDNYRPGDTARLTATLPFAPARVQLLVGRRALRYQEERTVALPTCEFAVPVKREFGRNVTVSLLAHRLGGRNAALERKSSAFVSWHDELRRDPESYRLGVELVPSRNYASPKDWITLDVFTKDAGGKPHQSVVTVYAVDEGNLLLTDYQTPDPLPSFTRVHPTLFSLLDIDEDLTRLKFPESRLGHGSGTAGGHGYGRSSIRRPGVVTSLFRSGLATDNAGKLEVKFQLPGDLTRYRIMAVAAADDDAYGRGETTVTSRLPLSTRAVFPKVAWKSDAFEAELAITSFLQESREVSVRVLPTGLSLRSPEVQRLRVAPRHTEIARFMLRADRVGKAGISFESSAGDATDAVHHDIDVRDPMDTRTVATYGKTLDRVRESIGQLSSSAGVRRALELTIGNSPVTAVPSLATNLRRLCESDLSRQTAETLAIGLFESVSLGELRRRMPVFSPEHSCIEQLNQQLRKRQQRVGGFCAFGADSFASRDTCHDPELTAFVSWVLDREELNGKLEREMLDHSVKYLRRLKVQEYRQPELALGLLVHAAHGPLPSGAWAAAYESRIHWPAQARAWLTLAARKTADATAEQRSQLEQELLGQVRMTADRAEVVQERSDSLGHYDSRLSDTATVLYGLLNSTSANLAAPLLRGLGVLQAKDDDELSQAWGFLALNEYLRREPSDLGAWQGRVNVGSQTVLDVKTEKGQAWGIRRLTGTQLASLDTLDFEHVAGGPLFYTARLSISSPNLPVAAEDHGFGVEQRVYRMHRSQRTELLAGDRVTVKQGDVLMIEVAVTVPSPRHGVWVDVPLATQFEVIDRMWRNTETWLRDKQESDIFIAPSQSFYLDGKMRFYLDRPHAGLAKMRFFARAFLRGESVTAPVTVKEVHNPEVYGRTGLRRWLISP